jgi:hypothetical protein
MGESVVTKTRIFVVCCVGLVQACAGRSPEIGLPSAEAVRCAAVSDSLSKYVSQDALPLAHMVGTPVLPGRPAALMPGDSVYVEFAVRPDGLADPSTIQISGPSDPNFVRNITTFAAQGRFTAAQVDGCSVVSKYNLVVKR